LMASVRVCRAPREALLLDACLGIRGPHRSHSCHNGELERKTHLFFGCRVPII
jgi:hypothetical protein